MLLQPSLSLQKLSFDLQQHRETLCVFNLNSSSSRRRRTRVNPCICALEKESEFELDREKAREALKKLDQQLQELSQKETSTPRRRVSSSKLVLEAEQLRKMLKEDVPEFSASYLGYSAFTLLAFSILYNIFFISVIKPSVDGS